MQLCRTVLHFLEINHPLVVRWLEQQLGSKWSQALLSGDRLRLTVIKDEVKQSKNINDSGIIRKLTKSEDKILATSVAWLLCKFLDYTPSVDFELRNLILVQQNILLERVPFTLENNVLAAMCDPDFCSGDPTEDGTYEIKMDNGTLVAIIPLDDSMLRKMLFQRLRRITQ